MLRAIQIIDRIAPHMQPAYANAFNDGDDQLAEHGVDSPPRLAHFLAQVLHETGRGAFLYESLNYSTPARLLEIFGVGNHSAAIRPEEAAGLLHNEPALAERVYGLGNPAKAQELGNTQPGDGYRYRGGGLLQTTGRGNYHRLKLLSGIDFEANPALVVEARFALLPALHEWSQGGLNIAADRNDILTITRVINGGLNGLAERRDLFAEIRAVMDTMSLSPTA